MDVTPWCYKWMGLGMDGVQLNDGFAPGFVFCLRSKSAFCRRGRSMQEVGAFAWRWRGGDSVVALQSPPFLTKPSMQGGGRAE